MNFVFGLFTVVLSVFIAYSAAKNFWSAPLAAIIGDSAGSDKVNFEEIQANATPVPTPTPTPTSTSTIAPTTTTLGPCANGCIVTIGTANGPMAPPPYNTSYNGRNPMITSYPTDQP